MIDFKTITKEQLESLYKENSIKGVATLLGVSHYKVEKKLTQFNIQKHSRKDSIVYGNRKIHGVDNVMYMDSSKNKIKDTNMQKYGVECVFQSELIQEKICSTCMQRYGVQHPVNIQSRRDNATKTSIQRYGKGNGNNRQKALQTMQDIYGVQHALQNVDVLKKSMDTCLDKYGVMYNCLTPQCNHKGSKYSKVNQLFYEKLLERFPNHSIVREFPLNNFLYDFCVDDKYLIEVNPTITHNSDFSPYGEHKGVSIDYHKQKALMAIDNGYLPIFIYDWDNVDCVMDKMFSKSGGDSCLGEIHLDKFYCDYLQHELLPIDWKENIIENVVVYNIKNNTIEISEDNGYKVYTAGKLIIKT